MDGQGRGEGLNGIERKGLCNYLMDNRGCIYSSLGLSNWSITCPLCPLSFHCRSQVSGINFYQMSNFKRGVKWKIFSISDYHMLCAVVIDLRMLDVAKMLSSVRWFSTHNVTVWCVCVCVFPFLYCTSLSFFIFAELEVKRGPSQTFMNQICDLTFEQSHTTQHLTTVLNIKKYFCLMSGTHS